MLKVLTYMGKLEDFDPHKEFWWKLTSQEQLQIANESFLRNLKINICETSVSVKKIDPLQTNFEHLPTGE